MIIQYLSGFSFSNYYSANGAVRIYDVGHENNSKEGENEDKDLTCPVLLSPQTSYIAGSTGYQEFGDGIFPSSV